jgi:hypothetical protein
MMLECITIPDVVRGVPLSLARRRLAQIAQLAREARMSDAACRNWSDARFEQIEQLADTLVEAPPADLSAMAMDLLELLRAAMNRETSRFSDLFEDVHDKPDWRLAYLSYFVPFALAILGDATWGTSEV